MISNANGDKFTGPAIPLLCTTQHESTHTHVTRLLSLRLQFNDVFAKIYFSKDSVKSTGVSVVVRIIIRVNLILTLLTQRWQRVRSALAAPRKHSPALALRNPAEESRHR